MSNGLIFNFIMLNWFLANWGNIVLTAFLVLTGLLIYSTVRDKKQGMAHVAATVPHAVLAAHAARAAKRTRPNKQIERFGLFTGFSNVQVFSETL